MERFTFCLRAFNLVMECEQTKTERREGKNRGVERVSPYVWPLYPFIEYAHIGSIFCIKWKGKSLKFVGGYFLSPPLKKREKGVRTHMVGQKSQL